MNYQIILGFWNLVFKWRIWVNIVNHEYAYSIHKNLKAHNESPVFIIFHFEITVFLQRTDLGLNEVDYEHSPVDAGVNCDAIVLHNLVRAGIIYEFLDTNIKYSAAYPLKKPRNQPGIYIYPCFEAVSYYWQQIHLNENPA